MRTLTNRRLGRAVCALACVLLVPSAVTSVRGQANTQGRNLIRDTDDGIKYARGQNVVPVFEGWVANPDGTFGLVFGTFNRNWEEDMSIPIGPDNHIEPGIPDQGQPTFFYPRRGKNLFEVTVPKDFGKKEVVWTLTSRGRTEKAYGALVPQEVLTRRMVLAGGSLNDQAAAGNDDQGDEQDPNRPPTVAFDPPRPVVLPGKAALTATVADDGLPKPAPGRARENARALRVEWATYRGPARALFDPPTMTSPSPAGGKVSTTATFKEPGTYVLRAKATDGGGLEQNANVIVAVK
jgi:hypothetical protein